jgi:inner membrane protein
MGVLLLALNVPLTMMCGVVSERTARRDAVAAEVSRNWGDAQTIIGPVLTVPFRHQWSDQTGKIETLTAHYNFLPEALDVEAVIEPAVRTRTIFKVNVYTVRAKMRGRFEAAVLPTRVDSRYQVLWDQAELNMGVSDPRGIARVVTLVWNGQRFQCAPGVGRTGLFASGVHAPVPAIGPDHKEPIPFEVELEIKGTKELRFLPGASETTAHMTSTWPHPGFVGIAPDSPQVDATGFAATWRLSYSGLGLPTSWKVLAGEQINSLSTQANASTFGVTLVQPVDVYVQTDRATKYAVLFIVMTFVVAFLWEVAGSALVHPIQYLFVGFAMCLFYLLLLSIAEHRGFDTAYAIAASATTLLLAWYWTWVLGGRRQGVMMGGVLTLLYGYLYLLLRLEDYALLAGSCGLFAMLAMVMFLTRRVNWYELRLGARAS